MAEVQAQRCCGSTLGDARDDVSGSSSALQHVGREVVNTARRVTADTARCLVAAVVAPGRSEHVVGVRPEGTGQGQGSPSGLSDRGTLTAGCKLDGSSLSAVPSPHREAQPVLACSFSQ